MTSLAAPLPYSPPVADILTRAADHAETYTENATRMIVADSIGAALGYHRPIDVDFYVIPCVIDGESAPHPAFAAVMAWLAVVDVQSVWRWSALQTPAVVASMLRQAAARAAVTYLSCGHTWPGHYPSCEFETAAAYDRYVQARTGAAS